MAVSAIDTVIADMVFMAEGDGLIVRAPYTGRERTRVNRVSRTNNNDSSKQYGGDSDLRNAIRTAWKQLGHLLRGPIGRRERLSGSPHGSENHCK